MACGRWAVALDVKRGGTRPDMRASLARGSDEQLSRCFNCVQLPCSHFHLSLSLRAPSPEAYQVPNACRVCNPHCQSLLI